MKLVFLMIVVVLGVFVEQIKSQSFVILNANSKYGENVVASVSFDQVTGMTSEVANATTGGEGSGGGFGGPVRCTHQNVAENGQFIFVTNGVCIFLRCLLWKRGKKIYNVFLKK